jgi:hypothetical protein
MRTYILVILGLFLCVSCSRIPEPAGFDYSSQSKLQAAHHWDVLAKDIAYQINNELLKDNFLDTSVYVQKTCGSDDAPCKPNETTEFDEAFHDLLVTELVHLGIPVDVKPQWGTITVNYKVQTVYHQADRIQTLAPGTITGLTAAVVVLRNAPSEVLALATAGAIDLANTLYVRHGHYEVIITTSMVNMKQYLFRSSNIYYINDKDFWHYQANNSGKAKTIQLTDSDNASEQAPWDTHTMQKPGPKPPPPPHKTEDKTLPKPIRNI